MREFKSTPGDRPMYRNNKMKMKPPCRVQDAKSVRNARGSRDSDARGCARKRLSMLGHPTHPTFGGWITGLEEHWIILSTKTTENLLRTIKETIRLCPTSLL
jgi:hypothetical protein